MNFFKRIFRQSDREYLLSRGMTEGEETHIYSYPTIDHIYPHLISIGERVTISTNVTILAHDASTNVVRGGTKLGRVTIGNNVFVGTGTIILCNTRIGDNVVIGAGSIVTHDLPGNAVYAGSPAKRICSIEDYRERVHQLREERPDLSQIRAWDRWENAPAEDREKMKSMLSDGVGFI